MKERLKNIGLVVFLSTSFFAGQAAETWAGTPISDEGVPLSRRYHAGDVLKYKISGSHSTNGALDFDWQAHALSTAVGVAGGPFREDVQWTSAEWAGKPVERPVKDVGFRQTVSLDPAVRLGVPDLSQVDRSLIAPITDLLTFYSDYWLAVKHGIRLKAGDHAYVHYGKPSSWADGARVVVGYDCIDFDLSVAAVDTNEKTATLTVRHVPPDGGCERAPTEWMRKPVAGTANNWFQVEKKSDGRYEAGFGQETFAAEIKIILPSGIIKSAVLFNPVKLRQQACKDAALSNCEAPESEEIIRRINLALEP